MKFDYYLDIKVANKQISAFFYLFIICSFSFFYMLYKYNSFLFENILFYYSIWIIFQYSFLKKAKLFGDFYHLYVNTELKETNKKINISEILKIINGFYLRFLILNISFFSIFFYLFKNNYIKDGIAPSLMAFPFSISASVMFLYSFNEKLLVKEEVNENISKK